MFFSIRFFLVTYAAFLVYLYGYLSISGLLSKSPMANMASKYNLTSIVSYTVCTKETDLRS